MNLNNNKMKRRWTEQEITTLKDLFPYKSAQCIGGIINRSPLAVNLFANKLGLKKPKGFQRRNYFEIILDGSLQSQYWIGFLLADGHFHKHGNTVRLDQSINDINIIQEYKKYIQSESNILISEYENKSDMCSITCVNSDAVNQLKTQYDISSNKTTHPPNFQQYNLTHEQWIALFIGLIDGDGYVQYTTSENRVKINIEMHLSWIHNLQLIKRKIYEYFEYEFKMTDVAHNPNLLTTVRTSIASPTVIKGLYQFIQENDLFYMKRKWDVIKNVYSIY